MLSLRLFAGVPGGLSERSISKVRGVCGGPSSLFSHLLVWGDLVLPDVHPAIPGRARRRRKTTWEHREREQGVEMSPGRNKCSSAAAPRMGLSTGAGAQRPQPAVGQRCSPATPRAGGRRKHLSPREQNAWLQLVQPAQNGARLESRIGSCTQHSP